MASCDVAVACRDDALISFDSNYRAAISRDHVDIGPASAQTNIPTLILFFHAKQKAVATMLHRVSNMCRGCDVRALQRRGR
jgi:hypothetical protein